MDRLITRLLSFVVGKSVYFLWYRGMFEERREREATRTVQSVLPRIVAIRHGQRMVVASEVSHYTRLGWTGRDKRAL